MKDILTEAKKYVNRLLMPLWNYYYHSYEHAVDVMSRAMYLAQKEWLGHDDIEMIGLAWLFHDSGFIIQYDNNEFIWAKIAQNFLKSMAYPAERIELIEEIIIATNPEYKNPKNIYEKIIKDADLDNLWRDDFIEKWNNLKKERELVQNIKIKDPEWEHSSATLLREHKFYTKSQREEREKQMKENLKRIEEWYKDERASEE